MRDFDCLTNFEVFIEVSLLLPPFKDYKDYPLTIASSDLYTRPVLPDPTFWHTVLPNVLSCLTAMKYIIIIVYLLYSPVVIFFISETCYSIEKKDRSVSKLEL